MRAVSFVSNLLCCAAMGKQLGKYHVATDCSSLPQYVAMLGARSLLWVSAQRHRCRLQWPVLTWQVRAGQGSSCMPGEA